MVNKSPWDDETKAIALGMKRAGLPCKKIAERLGVSVSAVRGLATRKKAHTRITGTKGPSIKANLLGKKSKSGGVEDGFDD